MYTIINGKAKVGNTPTTKQDVRSLKRKLDSSAVTQCPSWELIEDRIKLYPYNQMKPFQHIRNFGREPCFKKPLEFKTRTIPELNVAIDPDNNYKEEKQARALYRSKQYQLKKVDRCVSEFKLKRKLGQFNRKTHVYEQAGSILDVDFSKLLEHEELIIDICMLGGAISTASRLSNTLFSVGILLHKYLRKRGLAYSFKTSLDWLKSQIGLDVNEQAAETIDAQFKQPQDWWSKIRHSCIWKDVYKLIAYSTCIIVHGFDTEKLKKAQRYVADTKIMKACNQVKFIDSVSSIVENVCTKIYQSFRTGNILSFFHSGDTYQEWYNSALRAEHDFLETQNDTAYDRHGLLQTTMDLIKQGEEICKVQELDSISAKPDRRKEAIKGVAIIRNRLRGLIELRQKLMNIMNSVKLRETPFSLLICGRSSIGKSIFSEVLRRHFGIVQGLADIPAYVRNSALPHWDNFESYYWCILLDDAACFKPEKLIGIDPSLGEVIMIINPISNQPPRADLADKGRAAIQAKLVMITTNVEDLNVSTYFSHPAAVMRRCGFQILLEVKPEFASEVGQGLDSFKANHKDDTYPDWWWISVNQPSMKKAHDPSAQTGKISLKETCEFIPVLYELDGVTKPMQRVSMRIFLAWYNKAIKIHFEKQSKMLASQDRIAKVPLCSHDIPTGMCECGTQREVVEQAGRMRVDSLLEEIIPEVPQEGVHIYEDADGNRFIDYDEDWDAGIEDEEIFETMYPSDPNKEEPQIICCGSTDQHYEVEIPERSIHDLMTRPVSNITYVPPCIQGLIEQSAPSTSTVATNVTESDLPDEESFSISGAFVSVKVKLSSIWATLSLPGFLTALCLFMLRDSSSAHNNFFMRNRDEFVAKVSMVWTLARLYMAWAWPLQSFSLYPGLLLVPIFYALLHPMETVYKLTGDTSYNNQLQTSFYYFKQLAILKLAVMSDKALDAVQAIGQSTVLTYSGAAFCLLVLCALAKMIKYFMSLFKTDEVSEQGQAFSYGKPFSAKGEPESCYARPRTELDILDIPLHARSMKGKSIGDVSQFYARNLAHVVAKDLNEEGPMGRSGNMLFIRGHMAIIQTHILKPQSIVKMKLTFDGFQGTSRDIEVFVEANNVLPLGEHLSLIHVQSTPLHKDLTLSLPDKAIRQFRGRGFMIKRDRSGSIDILRLSNLRYSDSMFSLLQSGWIYRPERPTIEGDCGSLIFALTPSGPVLVGVHQYWSSKHEECGATDLTLLEETIVKLTHKEIVPGSVCKQKGKAGNLVDLHEKSIARTTEKPVNCEVYGSFDGHRQKGKSGVERTIFATDLEEQGFAIDYGKPNMTFEASNRHFESLSKEKFYRHQNVMRAAMMAYLDHVMESADGQWFDECHIVDQQTAINGQPGVRFVEAINLKTSAGHPWSEGKKKHMFTESGDWNDERFVKEHIQDEINRIFECWSNGSSSNTISKASLKDEARKKKKILEKNTRVFFASSLPFTVAQRQLFLWFARVVQRNPYVFMMAPGIDASGPEWDRLYHYLFDFSDQVIAGDFKEYDITMSAEELHFAYEFICLLGSRLGASEEHVSMMNACAEDMIHVLVDYFATLVRLTCNPSGQAITVLINGIVNVLRLITLYAVGRKPKNDEEAYEYCVEFFDKVHVMVYGDDNLMTVKDAPFYTHTFLQDEFSKMGITYTMADKDQTSVPYISFKESTFLKRGFRFEMDLDRWVAPLEEASMVKMLGVYIPSKTESMEQQLSQSIQNCHRESFLHGRKHFEKWDKLIKLLIEKHSLEDYVTLHSWDYYISWYKAKDGVVEQSGSVLRPSCSRCGYLCQFVHYADESDVRLCNFCKRCRFVDSDLDCCFCGLEDTCYECGRVNTISVVCDFTVHGSTVRMYCSECEICEVENQFLRILDDRPNGLGRGGFVSLHQNSSS